jgi:signal peptidase II
LIELLVSGLCVLLLDRWSKRAIERHLGDRPVALGPVVRLRRVRHVKSIYEDRRVRPWFVMVWLIAFSCALTLNRSGMGLQAPHELLGAGAALGGALGNLDDILRRRAVTDFIDLRWWPVFNLADIAIVGGLAMIFWPGR